MLSLTENDGENDEISLTGLLPKLDTVVDYILDIHTKKKMYIEGMDNVSFSSNIHRSHKSDQI